MTESEPIDERKLPITPQGLQGRIFFLITFVALLILTWLLLKPFFNVILVSLITVIVLKPLYSWFYRARFTEGKPRLSASVTMVTFVFVLVVPVAILVFVFIDQLSQQLLALADFDVDAILLEIENSIATTGQSINFDKAAIQGLITDAASAVFDAAISFAGKLLSALPKLIVEFMIFFVVTVTLLPGFDKLVEDLEEISPLGKEITQLYYTKTIAMITSLFKGIFLIAGIQALVMGIFYWLAGIDALFFFIVVTMFLAMLPVVGISFLVIFMAVVFLLNDNPTSAAIVLIGFYGVVNWIDVILRPRLVSKEAYMHFSLVLLGILGGLAFGGLLGMFYGPVIILLLVTTIDIYREQFAQDDSAVIGDLIKTEVAERLEEPGTADDKSQA
jgi:predicted PurR-regulated permease PerM